MTELTIDELAQLRISKMTTEDAADVLAEGTDGFALDKETTAYRISSSSMMVAMNDMSGYFRVSKRSSLN